MSYYYFKNNHSFDDRLSEAMNALNKYPGRLPIICEKFKNNTDLPDIDKNKYLVPIELTLGQFIYVIRKRIKLTPEEAIFLCVGNFIPPSWISIGELYTKHRDSDCFLYISYTKENTFG